MIRQLDNFDHVIGCDFEYSQPEGENPSPVCMVAHDLQTGERWRLGADELHRSESAPFPADERTLFVAYYASAEINCFRALDWARPVRILDLFVEFRCITSGMPVPCGNGLLGAMTYYGIDSIDVAEKAEMRKLAMRGGPYSGSEMVSLIDYCETDVVALDKLLWAMLPKIDLSRAMLRGRYMAAASSMETVGIPVDVETLQRLRENWESIKSRLVVEVDSDYGVYVPTNRRQINPDSPFGQMIFAEAEVWNIDPYELLDAVNYVWKEHRESTESFYKQKQIVRKITGLTVNRIAKWENGFYRDHSSYPGFDAKARDIAGRFPSLGIGEGYESESGYDQTDYAAKLWNILRDEQDKPSARHDPAIMRQAAEMVARGESSYVGQPMSFSTSRFAEYLAENDIP